MKMALNINPWVYVTCICVSSYCTYLVGWVGLVIVVSSMTIGICIMFPIVYAQNEDVGRLQKEIDNLRDELEAMREIEVGAKNNENV